MGFLPGGVSEKLGNRFEGSWVAKQLLFLLNEQLRAVQIEGVGDDEEGVDLWVTRLDGSRQAQQCKGFNKSKGNWPLADLKARGILDKAVSQLQRDANVSFQFVSAIGASELEDLSRNAREFGSNPDQFVWHYVESCPRKEPFAAFCRYLDIDPATSEGRVQAVDLLSRLHARVFQDDPETRNELRCLASLLIAAGSPDTVIAALCDIAQQNIRRVLTAPEMIRLLEPYGLRVIPRGLDARVAARVRELYDDFVHSIKPYLAAERLIPRRESGEVLARLQRPSETDAIVVHGAPGYGKSGVLYQLAEELRQSGATVLAIRLDRKAPNELNTGDFGRRLGLTGSPVACLRDISAEQPAVLILDQLDALRWTSSHAGVGLDICKAMLREVQAARTLGARIDVILACRTFDLERDPEIQAWLTKSNSSLRISKVEVGALPSGTVREVVQAQGVKPDSLPGRQLLLLESVQRLAMWIEIVKTESGSPNFDSSTQLLRTFWENRRRKLEECGCDAVRLDGVIRDLVGYMEEHACLTAPEALLGPDKKLAHELQSLGVINLRNGIVCFGHQSNLDFLIAEGVLRSLHVEGLDILGWLSAKNRQTLFRREQLRQVLFLLADGGLPRFLSAVIRLLDSPDVRFHLKQLALETLGQVTPTPQVLDVILRLLDDPAWAEHVRDHVVFGNAEIVRGLHARGMLIDQLTSAKSEDWQRAAAWLRSVWMSAPDVLVELSRQVIQQTADWPERVSRMIGRHAQDTESDEVFDLLLRCVTRGSEPHYTQWETFAVEHPSRAIRLYHALVTAWIRRGAEKKDWQEVVHVHGRKHIDALSAAARTCPQLAWELLWPLLRKVVRLARKQKRDWASQHPETRFPMWHERVLIPMNLRQAVRSAGCGLAKTDPDRMLLEADHPLVQKSRTIRSLFSEILASVPLTSADSAIRWLLEDARRLHCGSGRKKPRWTPAMRLIKRLSPHCSLCVFERLEPALLKFRDPEEKRLANHWLSGTRRGFFQNQFGVGQFHLLPALCPKRRSVETTGRIGVLRNKFDTYPQEAFLSRRFVGGGLVSSRIDVEHRYARMSDKAWLRLILNDEIGGPGKCRRVVTGRAGSLESSVEMFSRSFGGAAMIDPERFARLALQIPADAPREYLTRVLYALAKMSPPDEIPEDRRPAWRPASPESVARVLERVSVMQCLELAIAFCRTVQDRNDIPLEDAIVERLLSCVDHGDPKADELHVFCNESAAICSVDTLETNALNAVRPLAAMAIASLLWRDIGLLSRVTPAIERLIADEHPAVRVAAVHICPPVWNVDKALAVRWLLTAASSDLRVAASHQAREFYNYAFKSFSDALVPLVRAMIRSPIDEVAEAGAQQAAARWLFQGVLEGEFRQCLSGSIPQRKGVADVMAQLVMREEYRDCCLLHLTRLLNDQEKVVRREALSVLRDEQLWECSWAPDFLRRMVTSGAGVDEGSILVWKLKDRHDDLEQFADVVFALSSVLMENVTGVVKGTSWLTWHIDDLMHLLLRLYGQSHGPDDEVIRQRCLDTWDAVLQSRASLAWSLTRGLEGADF